MIAYLSGPIENAENEGSEWRIMMSEWLSKNLGHEVFDPVIESKMITKDYNSKNFRRLRNLDPPKYKRLIREIINKDLSAVIDQSDYLIVVWDKSVFKGGGTHGEVTIAYWFKKPIYLVNLIPPDDLSSWIFSCTTEIFHSFDDIKKMLIKEYGPV